MGDCEFADVDAAGGKGPSATIPAPASLEHCARVLGLSPASLAKVFCERQIESATERLTAPRTARAAAFARDACAKSLYASVFEWTLLRINKALQPRQAAPCALGVLDIFGFETFQVNGFEQLLINFTNEALQGTFNSQIFVAEAALYLKEGLVGADEYITTPVDNHLCVDLLLGDPAKKDPGLLLTIDSEGRSPDASDVKLNARLHQLFGASGVASVAAHARDPQARTPA
jgi:myosin heavy subunit